MFRIVKTQTRPSTDVDFWTNQNVSIEVFQYVNTNHQPNIINAEVSISEDGLTLTKTTTWTSKSAYEAFLSDLIVIESFINPSHVYMNDNGIIYDTGVGEEI